MAPVQADNPTPYPELNAILRDLVIGARDALGDNFVAAYLQGSFALGDFDIHSDVDFVVAVARDISDAALAELQALHGRIYDRDVPWAKHLEGSYIPLAILRRADPANTPLLFLDNTSRALAPSTHDNTLVVRWVVREYGIALSGPPATELIDPVDPGDLRREVLATMREWAGDIFANPEQMSNRWYQPFAVLSYCRMLYTIETGRIASKPASARWAQHALDAGWSGLIGRAWDDRPDPSSKARQPADQADFKSTLEFMRYAIEWGERRAMSK